MERVEGIVSWFDDGRGYGFIRYQKRDIFVHFTDIGAGGRRKLASGQRVSFVLAGTPKGPKATEVLPEGDGSC